MLEDIAVRCCFVTSSERAAAWRLRELQPATTAPTSAVTDQSNTTTTETPTGDVSISPAAGVEYPLDSAHTLHIDGLTRFACLLQFVIDKLFRLMF